MNHPASPVDRLHSRHAARNSSANQSSIGSIDHAKSSTSQDAFEWQKVRAVVTTRQDLEAGNNGQSRAIDEVAMSSSPYSHDATLQELLDDCKKFQEFFANSADKYLGMHPQHCVYGPPAGIYSLARLQNFIDCGVDELSRKFTRDEFLALASCFQGRELHAELSEAIGYEVALEIEYGETSKAFAQLPGKINSLSPIQRVALSDLVERACHLLEAADAPQSALSELQLVFDGESEADVASASVDRSAIHN